MDPVPPAGGSAAHRPPVPSSNKRTADVSPDTLRLSTVSTASLPDPFGSPSSSFENPQTTHSLFAGRESPTPRPPIGRRATKHRVDSSGSSNAQEDRENDFLEIDGGLQPEPEIRLLFDGDDPESMPNLVDPSFTAKDKEVARLQLISMQSPQKCPAKSASIATQAKVLARAIDTRWNLFRLRADWHLWTLDNGP
ncbi:hypothetical protein C8R44DRAFT_737837 [Mycena epipterygia]|nr:hypothetical protein C8R44DRAFT_737837 [Mycena epipterygia]